MAPRNDKDDPVAKIGKMIDDAVESALGKRDRAQLEKDDPWERLAGIVDRAVDKALDRRLGEFDDDDEEEDEPRARRSSAKKAGTDPISLFGGA